MYGKRKLRRLGGAARLSELDEEIQNVLVNPTRCEFKSRNRELLGLQHPSVRIEAAITKILEERGLA